MNNDHTTHYQSSTKIEALELRKSGFSLAEISKFLNISKSTASLWLNKTPLNKIAQEKIDAKKQNAREKGLQTIQHNRFQNNARILNHARRTVSSINLNNDQVCKVLCSLLYWGEGSKTGHRTAFINSDPVMIAAFLKLLRKAFKINENKLRALVHLHEYHNEPEMKQYWSNLTGIPLSRFTKSYLKPHTAKSIRPGYKGAIRISYYDAAIVNELKAIYNTLASSL